MTPAAEGETKELSVGLKGTMKALFLEDQAAQTQTDANTDANTHQGSENRCGGSRKGASSLPPGRRLTADNSGPRPRKTVRAIRGEAPGHR